MTTATVKSIWTEQLKNPDNWENVADIGKIEGVSVVGKEFVLWKDLDSSNNIGRAKGINPEAVLDLANDIEQFGIDNKQQPIYVNIKTKELITGDHRKSTKNVLKECDGWMVIWVECVDECAEKILYKLLNNQRATRCLYNSREDIVELIKYGISNNKLKTEQEIKDEIDLQSNISLRKEIRKSILKEIMNYIENNGIESVEPDRYRTYDAKSYIDFVQKSIANEDEYALNVIQDHKQNTMYYNLTSGTSAWSIYKEMAKCANGNKPLSIQFSTDVPSKKMELKDKREKFNDVLDEIVEMHKAVNRYVNENLFFPHQHPDSQHAAMAQDYKLEHPKQGQFIRNY